MFSCLPLASPWGAAFSGSRPLTVHALLDGRGWLESHELPAPVPLGTGDLVLGRAGAPYRVVHAPGAVATPIAELRAAASGLADPAPAGATRLLCGAYALEGSVCDGLLAALPRFVLLRAADRDDTLDAAIRLLEREIVSAAPGQQTVLDHLLDLILVYALRVWFALPGHRAPGWYVALDDPRLGAALRALHDRPAARWTVETMAREAGLSRAAFARRFSEVVGESPARYVARLRVELAEAALLRPGAKLAAVAEEVGYSTEFAFSDAFKRLRGTTPGRWREAQRYVKSAAPT